MHLACQSRGGEGTWETRMVWFTPIAEVDMGVVLARESPPSQDQAEAVFWETSIVGDAAAQIGNLGRNRRKH